MATTLIDLLAEAKMKRQGEDPNAGICIVCHEEKVTRNGVGVCPTCFLKAMNHHRNETAH